MVLETFRDHSPALLCTGAIRPPVAFQESPIQQDLEDHLDNGGGRLYRLSHLCLTEARDRSVYGDEALYCFLKWST